MANKAQIRNEALGKLGVLASGATANSEDASLIDDAYDQVFAALEERDIAFFDQDDVPDEAINPLAAKVAWSKITNFNVSDKRYMRINFEASTADRDLCTVMNGSYISAHHDTDY